MLLGWWLDVSDGKRAVEQRGREARGCSEAGQAARGGEAKSRGCSAFSLTCLSFSFSLVLTGFPRAGLR